MPRVEEDTLRRSIIVFIDNLPQGVWKVWLYNIFSRFGKILSIYISKKKSKISGTLFGFVRLGSSHDALRAIKKVNGLCIWGKTLMANIARFEGQNKWELGNGGRLKNRAQVWWKREDQMDPKKQRTSYDGGRLLTVKVKELGNG
ncbi:uncharacterized protein LOC130788148 [Actinidia eriantha]|uniref:uncharacterized protein LOC130788148 n=1 Tax=Actinidia eriantha TaxID=165200 RepID=UPI00258C0AE2|nr:uncharacterized protein LOC130788148 [Actinidia eriantha]